LAHANEASARYRLNSTYRLQLPISLASLLRSGLEVRVSEQAMDRANEIASTAAPYNAGILMVRAEYLLNARRCGPELDRIVVHLSRYATAFPDTARIRGFYEKIPDCGPASGRR
jgi:hypothetical protein